jgi:hypothetical protein
MHWLQLQLPLLTLVLQLLQTHHCATAARLPASTYPLGVSLSSGCGSNNTWQACPTQAPAGCIPAQVPGTAFVALAANGSFPSIVPGADPYLDCTLQEVPDISVTGPALFTLSYTTTAPATAPLRVAQPHTVLTLAQV